MNCLNKLSKIPKEYLQCKEESYEDWKYRLIVGKTEKTVDISWNEIIDLLNLKCSSEYLRKLAYGVSEYKTYRESLIKRREATSDEIDELAEIELKKLEAEKERVKLRDIRRETKAMVREWARADNIKDEIIHAIEVLGEDKPLKVAEFKEKVSGPNEGVVLLSDWHKGLLTNNYWNKFDDAEFNKRIDKLTNKTIQFGKFHCINKLNVFVLGDIINGLIHVTTRIMNDEDTVKQTINVAETLAVILTKFADEFNELDVYMARGNHDRIIANKKESLASESFFDLIPWYLKTRLSSVSNINILDNEVDDEIISTKICGHNVFAIHGHRDNIKSAANNLGQMLRVFPEYIFMGHYHKNAEDEIRNCEIIVNSSLSGVDDYAKELRVTSTPAQKFMIFNQEDGRLCTYNIKLN